MTPSATHPALPAALPRPVPKLVADHIARLTADCKSLRVRCATLWRALHEQTPMQPVGTLEGGEPIQRVIALARYVESNGHLPAVRFARDVDGIITGIELTMLERTAADEAEGIAPTLDMGVVA